VVAERWVRVRELAMRRMWVREITMTVVGRMGMRELAMSMRRMGVRELVGKRNIPRERDVTLRILCSVREHALGEHTGRVEVHGRTSRSCRSGGSRRDGMVVEGVPPVASTSSSEPLVVGLEEASSASMRESVREGSTSSPMGTPSTLKRAGSRRRFFSSRSGSWCCSRSRGRSHLRFDEDTKNLSILHGQTKSILQLAIGRHGNQVTVVILVLENESYGIKSKQLAAQFTKASKSVAIEGSSPNLTSVRCLDSQSFHVGSTIVGSHVDILGGSGGILDHRFESHFHN